MENQTNKIQFKKPNFGIKDITWPITVAVLPHVESVITSRSTQVVHTRTHMLNTLSRGEAAIIFTANFSASG